jgi:ribosomal protein S18 acetylase RimI-like enzyme
MPETYNLPAAQTIRAATAQESITAGRILGSAFSHDPVLNWISPQWPMGEQLFTTTAILLYQPRGVVHINDTKTGAALWLPPGERHTTRLHWRSLVFSGQLLARAGVAGAKRGIHTEQVMSKAHPQEPHFYLHAIGAQLDHQGEGIGSALLKAGLRIADEASMPAYLESSNLRNNPLYERFGFEVTGEHRFPDGGPTVWFMHRPATNIVAEI